METKAVKPNRYNSKNSGVMIVSTLLVFLALGAAGCTQNRKGIEVLPLGNRSVLTLSSDDVVQVMRAAGFSDMQVWEHGTALRDGLARSGAVQIKVDGTVEAVLAVNGDSVYISTLGRGHFVYNPQTGWVNSGQR
jgi:hypothetical protein